MNFDPIHFIQKRTLLQIDGNSEFKPWNEPSMEIDGVQMMAAFGDAHGQMHKMAQGVTEWNRLNPRHNLNFGLQVGDFEAIRDEDDLRSVLGPAHHRHMGDFADYWSGRNRFPIPTHIIGGNHEAHRHFESMPSGGELAENLYYEGRVFARQVNGLKIAGLSGIPITDRERKLDLKHYHGHRPASLPQESGANGINWLPWIGFTKTEVDALKRLGLGANILMLHDWPAHLFDLMDPYTIRGKKHKRQAETGNEAAFEILESLKPDVLICGHMHHYLSGQIFWQGGRTTQVLCLDAFSAEKPVNDANMAVIQASASGIKIFNETIPRYETDEIRKLSFTIPNDKKNFYIALAVDQKMNETEILDGIQTQFAQISRGDRSFVYGGLKFELFYCESGEGVLSVDDIHRESASGFRLKVTPHFAAESLPGTRVLANTKKIMEVLQAAGLRPKLIAAFKDLI